jgi:hypothetical protein
MRRSSQGTAGIAVREVRISDADLQKIIGPPLRAFLKKNGFKSGTASDEGTGYFFPIDLDLAGNISVVRHADGTWMFLQEDALIADRVAQTAALHLEVIQEAEARR